jgi:hypothetical protein
LAVTLRERAEKAWRIVLPSVTPKSAAGRLGWGARLAEEHSAGNRSPGCTSADRNHPNMCSPQGIHKTMARGMEDIEDTWRVGGQSTHTAPMMPTLMAMMTTMPRMVTRWM